MKKMKSMCASNKQEGTEHPCEVLGDYFLGKLVKSWSQNLEVDLVSANQPLCIQIWGEFLML